jgi:hypothetical protein
VFPRAGYFSLVFPNGLLSPPRTGRGSSEFQVFISGTHQFEISVWCSGHGTASLKVDAFRAVRFPCGTEGLYGEEPTFGRPQLKVEISLEVVRRARWELEVGRSYSWPSSGDE